MRVSLCARSLGLLLIACGLVSGCGQTESARSTLAGTVTDEVGVPVKDAQVTVTASRSSAALQADQGEVVTTTTDSSGGYKIDAPAGPVSVTVAKEAFEPTQETVGNDASGGTPMNFDLKDVKGKPCDRMDVNDDHVISKDEWTGPPEDFVKLDTSGDGQLDDAERLAGRKARQERNPRKGPMDQNRDGKISREEWLGPADEFAKIDTNGDGFLDKQEMEANPPGQGAPPAPSPSPSSL